jgi:phage portal protein BeeE
MTIFRARRAARLVERADYPGQSNAATVMYQTWSGSPDAEPILPTFRSFVVDGYQANGVIFSTILARLMLFSEAELKWKRFSDDSLYGDQRLRLLERPWSNGSTGELFARMEQDVSLAGNAFIRNIDDEELCRLRPDLVTIVSGVREDYWGREYRKLVGYGWRNEAGNMVFFDKDEVAHWSPIPDPMANFRGMSWLTPVVREIDADTNLTDYKTKYLQNAATPNLLVRHPEELDKDTVNDLRERIQARHGGIDNAFKTLVLDGGADATIIGSNFEQLNLAIVQAAGENRIATAGGVPAIVIGLKEGLDSATYSNYGLAMRRFSDITMRPNWRTACSALETIVPPSADSKLWFDPSKIAALREGEKERADIAKQKALAIESLVRSGYDPMSAASAMEHGDFSRVQHTGLVSVQLQPPGTTVDGPPAGSNTTTGADA